MAARQWSKVYPLPFALRARLHDDAMEGEGVETARRAVSTTVAARLHAARGGYPSILAARLHDGTRKPGEMQGQGIRPHGHVALPCVGRIAPSLPTSIHSIADRTALHEDDRMVSVPAYDRGLPLCQGMPPIAWNGSFDRMPFNLCPKPVSGLGPRLSSLP